MARKNIFDFSDQSEPSQKAEDHSASSSFEQARPLAGMERDRANRPAALGAISQSLEKINERSARADEIERQLSNGQTIIELDPNLIDSKSAKPDSLCQFSYVLIQTIQIDFR
jgi:ParB family chromosome partitioning protein